MPTCWTAGSTWRRLSMLTLCAVPFMVAAQTSSPPLKTPAATAAASASRAGPSPATVPAAARARHARESPDVLRQNALRRCEALPDGQRKDCISRMQGQGTISGSVEGGGVYRELVTREVGVAPKAASAP